MATEAEMSDGATWVLTALESERQSTDPPQRIPRGRGPAHTGSRRLTSSTVRGQASAALGHRVCSDLL